MSQLIGLERVLGGGVRVGAGIWMAGSKGLWKGFGLLGFGFGVWGYIVNGIIRFGTRN